MRLENRPVGVELECFRTILAPELRGFPINLERQSDFKEPCEDTPIDISTRAPEHGNESQFAGGAIIERGGEMGFEFVNGHVTVRLR